MSHPIVSEDKNVNDAVWQQTLQEVADGFVEGPFAMKSIPADVPVSKRFGVVQGSKVRCVDDFTGSSVDLAVQSCESPRPHTCLVYLFTYVLQCNISSHVTFWLK